MGVLRDLVTGIDGRTHDLVRWAGLSGVLHGIFLSAYDVIQQHAHFDIQQFGIGFGALLGGVGAALKLKQDTEPQP